MHLGWLLCSTRRLGLQCTWVCVVCNVGYALLCSAMQAGPAMHLGWLLCSTRRLGLQCTWVGGCLEGGGPRLGWGLGVCAETEYVSVEVVNGEFAHAPGVGLGGSYDFDSFGLVLLVEGVEMAVDEDVEVGIGGDGWWCGLL